MYKYCSRARKTTPKYIFNDRYCEELSFPHLLPTEKCDYQIQRDTPLSPVIYFDQRLLKCSQKLLGILTIYFLHGMFLKILTIIGANEYCHAEGV